MAFECPICGIQPLGGDQRSLRIHLSEVHGVCWVKYVAEGQVVAGRVRCVCGEEILPEHVYGHYTREHAAECVMLVSAGYGRVYDEEEGYYDEYRSMGSSR